MAAPHFSDKAGAWRNSASNRDQFMGLPLRLRLPNNNFRLSTSLCNDC